MHRKEEGVNLKTEEEIESALKELLEKKKEGKPLTELQRIAWNGTKQALEWVLERTDILLTY